MSILHNIAVSLRPRLFAREVTILTVRTTPRIAECIKPVIERLIRSDRAGETYRCAVALWHRWDVPPLNAYLGTASLCRIDGPSITDERGYRPAGGLVETPGLTAHLSPDEAHDLDNRIKVAIETTIRAWADETMCGRWKISPNISIGGRKMHKPQRFCLYGSPDAAHRGKERGTHLTLRRAAIGLSQSRMRSGCSLGSRSVSRAISRLAEDTRRMRGEDGL